MARPPFYQHAHRLRCGAGRFGERTPTVGRVMTQQSPVLHDEPDRPRRLWLRILLGVVVALLVAMWVYAFLFAPREGVNRVGDRSWSERGEIRCAAAKVELLALADLRTIEEVGAGALQEKATIVDRTNAILAEMIDDLEATPPTDEKGQRLVPLWIADYRTYLGDREAYADQLRAGDNSPFTETEIDGSPITGYINDFARQNEMKSCQTPIDLTV